jgi:dolichol-phosphate mannosyltransferase
MSKNKILVFIATYNEDLNISDLFYNIIKISLEYDVLIIDDNSTDGTKESLEKLEVLHTCLTVLHRPRKMGVGSAHRAAMIYALKNKYEALVTMDADFSHSPGTIPQMLEKLKTSDFVIGSRYMKGGKSDYEGYRKWVSLIANKFARLTLGIKIHECTTSFRAFSVSLFNTLNLSAIKSNGYSFFLECVYELKSIDAKMTEVPIHFKDRFHGKSKIPKTEIFRSLYKLSSLFLSRFYKKQTQLSNPVKIESSCYFCNSQCLVEINHEDTFKDIAGAQAYQCTSLEHKSKPQVVNCLVCDLSFVPESSYPKNIETIYADVQDPTYLLNKKSRYRTFKESLTQISPFLPDKGNLLEVGSYCGFFLDTFKKKYNDWDYIGVEPSKWAAEYARSQLNINTRTGTLEDNIKDLSTDYDAVVAWDVLEHLNDPSAFLIQINSIMQQNGIFCFSTLDIDNWFPKIMGKHWPWLMEMHLFYYKTKTTEQLLNKAGFKILVAKKYVHYVSIHYLVGKIIAILPSWLEKPLNVTRSAMPQKIMIPISFGDIKLYICEKEKSIGIM